MDSLPTPCCRERLKHALSCSLRTFVLTWCWADVPSNRPHLGLFTHATSSLHTGFPATEMKTRHLRAAQVLSQQGPGIRGLLAQARMSSGPVERPQTTHWSASPGSAATGAVHRCFSTRPTHSTHSWRQPLSWAGMWGLASDPSSTPCLWLDDSGRNRAPPHDLGHRGPFVVNLPPKSVFFPNFWSFQ